MTQIDVRPMRLDEVGQPRRPDTPSTNSPKRRPPWSRIVWALLAVAVLVWIGRYVRPLFVPNFDPAKTGFTFRDDFPLHYPLLVVHALAGVVALVFGVLQLSSWLRERYPAAHRASGRIYVFAGAIPGSAVLMILVPLRATLDAAGVQTVLMMWAGLWLVTTVVGHRMARQGRYREHRRWMGYSVAAAMAVMVPGPILELVLRNVNFTAIQHVTLLKDVTAWVPWVLTLSIAHVWVTRTSRRRPG